MSLGKKILKSKVREDYKWIYIKADNDTFVVAVSKESHTAFLLNSQLFTILRLEEQEEANEALTPKKRTPSANTQYALSQILAVVGAGRSFTNC
jgi:hypothetical protein